MIDDKAIEQLLIKIFKVADKGQAEIGKILKDAAGSVSKEVESFYAKYGVIAEAPIFKTLEDGTQVISGYSKKLIVKPEDALVKLKTGTRMDKLTRQINLVLAEAARGEITQTIATLKEVADIAYYENLYTMHKQIGGGVAFDLLKPEMVTALVNNPLNGLTFSQRIWNNRMAVAESLNETLRGGMTQGLSVGQMTQNLTKKIYVQSKDSGTAWRNSKRLIQTEATRVANEAQRLSYENSKLVEKYIYVAVLDNSTSDVCADLDGEVFNVKDAVTGLNYPPLHPNCRSGTKAYWDDERDLQDRIARLPSNEQIRVPSNMTVNDYRRIYVDKEISFDEWNNR